MQEKLICETQLTGICESLKSVLNGNALCDAPRLVMNNSFAVGASRIRAILIAVVQRVLVLCWH